MSVGLGYSSRMGAARESAYGTPVHMTDLIPFTKESLTYEFEKIERQILQGLAGHVGLDRGSKKVSGSIECDALYTQKSGNYFNGIDLLLCQAMGGLNYCTSPGTDNGSNILTLGSGGLPVGNVGTTIAINKGVSIWEFVSCAFKGFKLSSKSSGVLTASFDVLANDCLITGTANEQAQFDALAASTAHRILHNDGIFRIGDLSDALSANDSLAITDFGFSFECPLAEDVASQGYDLTNGGVQGSTANRVIQPIQNGLRKATLSFTLPRYQSDTLRAFYDNDTELQFDAVYSASSAARMFTILCPRIKITKIDNNVEGPGTMPTKVEAQCFFNGGTLAAPGVNPYMTNAYGGSSTEHVPDEFFIELKNTTDGRTAVIWS